MIGVAGCGRMGAPMLDGLRDAVTNACGFDVAPKDQPWITDDADAFAQDLTTLITVVRDQVQTEDLLFGVQRFVERAPQLDRVVICSTLSPRYVSGLRARIPDTIALIDAPMSGAQVAAHDRKLSFMVGGTQSDVDDIIPILASMGAYFHHMGPLGAGMQAKVLNNLLAASSTVMTRLVLEWADTTDLDNTALLELIETSSGQNWFARGFHNIEFARDGHAPDNSIGILVKDVAAAIDAAPDGAELVLPQTLMTALRNLKPRTE